MKKMVLACALAVAALLVPVAAPAGSDGAAHVHTFNRTDSFAWITVYQQRTHVRTIMGAWCVPPHKPDQHGLSTFLSYVRVELSAIGCQHHPVLFDRTVIFPNRPPGVTSTTERYVITQKNGTYDFTFHT